MSILDVILGLSIKPPFQASPLLVSLTTGISSPGLSAAAEEDVKVGFLKPSKYGAREGVGLGQLVLKLICSGCAAAANADISDAAKQSVRETNSSSHRRSPVVRCRFIHSFKTLYFLNSKSLIISNFIKVLAINFHAFEVPPIDLYSFSCHLFILCRKGCPS